MSSDKLEGSHSTISQQSTNILQTDDNQQTSSVQSFDENQHINNEKFPIDETKENNETNKTQNLVDDEDRKYNEKSKNSDTIVDNNDQNADLKENDLSHCETDSKENAPIGNGHVYTEIDEKEFEKQPMKTEEELSTEENKEDQKSTENKIIDDNENIEQEISQDNDKLMSKENKTQHQESNYQITNELNESNQYDENKDFEIKKANVHRFNKKEIFLDEPTKVKSEKKIQEPIVRHYCGNKQKGEEKPKHSSSFPLPPPVQHINQMTCRSNLNSDQATYTPIQNIQGIIPQNQQNYNISNRNYYPQTIYPIYNTAYLPVPQFIVQVPQKSFQANQPKNEFQRIPTPIVSEEMHYKTYNQKNNGKCLIRCVCESQSLDGLLIQCKECHYYLHAICVNEPKKRDDFVCPFCSGKKIRCICKKENKFDEPLIQCQQCGFWSHKSCEKLEYGSNPKNFVCSQCGTLTYEIPEIHFSSEDPVPNSYVTVNVDRDEIINSIPNGIFQQLIIEELQKTQISFREIVEKFFHYFASLLFERVHEFWRVFVDTLSKILGCEKMVLLNAIDILSTKLLYKPNIIINDNMVIYNCFYEHSHSIDDYLNSIPAQKCDEQKEFVQLYKGKNGGIFTPIGLQDGALITVLPGLLMHTEEVQCEEGIPLSTLTITDHLIVIDTYGTNFTFAPIIRRSFHFNTILKLIRLNGELRVGLFAKRMKGPLNEEKSRRGFAISPDMEIILPFDGDIPYPIPKCNWKEKKRHILVPTEVKDEIVKQKQSIQTRSKKKNNKYDNDLIINMTKKENTNDGLTLLSSFIDESASTIPFILLPDDETVAKYKAIKENKERVRSRRGRYPANHNIN